MPGGSGTGEPGGGRAALGDEPVEAFSDGVFAIAITLLVLEIKVEPEDFEHLGRALVDSGPRTWRT